MQSESGGHAVDGTGGDGIANSDSSLGNLAEMENVLSVGLDSFSLDAHHVSQNCPPAST